jgi:hypothetical protein
MLIPSDGFVFLYDLQAKKMVAGHDLPACSKYSMLQVEQITSGTNYQNLMYNRVLLSTGTVCVYARAARNKYQLCD